MRRRRLFALLSCRALEQRDEAIELLVDLTEVKGDVLGGVRHAAVDLAEGVRGGIGQKIGLHIRS